VRISAATLGLPVVMLLAALSSLSWFSYRIHVKMHSDGRALPCVVNELTSTPYTHANGQNFYVPTVVVTYTGDAADGVKHRAYIHGSMEEGPLKPTPEAALLFLGATHVEGAGVQYTTFQIDAPPPGAYACYAKHDEFGDIARTKLERTRQPVSTDEYIVAAALVCSAMAGVYIAWLLVNWSYRKALAREVGVVRVLAIGLNYEECRTEGIGALTGITDSDNFVQMCEDAGVDDITYLTDRNFIANASRGMAPTKEVVAETIREIGSRTNDDDMFIFFYAGHGDNVVDLDGDEDDGKDEAFVLLDNFGFGSESTYLVDDEFAELLVESFSVNTRVLIFTDCCHSGTIADLERDDIYGERPIVHIAGTQDHQEAQDTGFGGAATTALLEVLKQLEGSTKKGGTYTIQEVFTKMQKWMVNHDFTARGPRVDPELQNITLNFTSTCNPAQIPWPITERGFIIDESHTNISMSMSSSTLLP
jgi:hypothetical protein